MVNMNDAIKTSASRKKMMIVKRLLRVPKLSHDLQRAQMAPSY
jgi:hypothetical protein